jgi:hypothetical protein
MKRTIINSISEANLKSSQANPKLIKDFKEVDENITKKVEST